MSASKVQKPNINELKVAEDIEALIVALRFPNEPQVRTQAIQALLEIGNHKAIAAIINALKTSYFFDVRKCAASSLGDYELSEVKEALVKALNDPIEEVSVNAALSLAKLGDIRAKEVLLVAQTSKNSDIRKIASNAVINLRNSSPKTTTADGTKTDKSSIYDKTAPNFNDKGVDLVDRGKYEEALQVFNKALSVNREYAPALFNKALLLEKKGAVFEAIQCYEKVLEMKPKDSTVLFKIACLKDKIGEQTEAISLYQTFLQQRNYQMSAEIDIARKRLQEVNISGKSDVDIRDVELSEKLKNKADYLDIMGDKKTAIATYNQAIRKNPENTDAWYNKGLCHESRGEVNDSLKCFKRVLELDPKDAGAWYNKAELEDKLKLEQDAIKSYKKFLNFSNKEMEKEIKQTKKRLNDLKNKNNKDLNESRRQRKYNQS